MKKKKLRILWILIIALNLIAWFVPPFCDFCARFLLPLELNTIGRFMSIFPFSVGEWLLLLAVLYVISFLVIAIIWIFLRKKQKYSRFAKKYAVIFATAVTIVCLIMTFNCTILYHCTPIRVSDNPDKEYSAQELEQVRNHIVEQCNYYSERMTRDADGYVIYNGNIMAESKRALHKLAKDFPRLKGYYPKTKPLAFSNFFSQAYIAGYYFPFSLESNYNDNMYVCNLPYTYCHELAHIHGYIYEDEANYLSFRACVESEDDFFVYCGYLGVLNYIENAYLSCVEMGKINTTNAIAVNELVQKDNIFLKPETWKRVEESAILSTDTVSGVSDKFTEGSLVLNGVKDGMNSYRRVVDLLLLYYDGRL